MQDCKVYITLHPCNLEFEDYEKEPEIRKALNEKLELLVMHENYTKCKTAPTAEEREKARQEYLDAKGIHPSFRW